MHDDFHSEMLQISSFSGKICRLLKNLSRMPGFFTQVLGAQYPTSVSPDQGLLGETQTTPPGQN